MCSSDLVAGTPRAMVSLGVERVEGYIKTIGLYRNKARNVVELSRLLLERHGGEVPDSREALEALRGRLDPRRYNGASLVGLNGVVIKSHGSADQLAFETAVQSAIVEARKGVPVQIGKLVETRAQ